MTRDVVERRLRDAVIARFRDPLADYLDLAGSTPEMISFTRDNANVAR